jgi:5-methylthioadenosine/S-adenosylhomocysteine deaminase
MTGIENRLLIKSVRIIDPAAPDNGLGDPVDILVKGERISAIGENLQSEDTPIVHGDGMIASAGLVDTHRHLWQTALRGCAANWSVLEYLENVRSGYSQAITPDDVYLSTLLGALEALDSGTTSMCDHCHIVASPAHAEAGLQALKDAGLRAVFCYGMFNPDSNDTAFPDHKSKVEGARSFLKSETRTSSALVHVGIAFNELALIDDSELVEEVRLLHDFDVLGSMHVGALAPGGIDRLARLDMLDHRMIFVHCNRLKDSELQMIAAKGSAISISPEAEMQMGMGFPITDRAISAGLLPTYGVDVVSAFSGDMWSQLRIALQFARAIQNQDSALRGYSPKKLHLGTGDMLKAGTANGARALRIDAASRLSPGCPADIILVKNRSIRLAGGCSLGHEILLQAHAADVDSVFVAGTALKRDGTLLRGDISGLVDRLIARSEELYICASSRMTPVRNLNFGFTPDNNQGRMP